MKDKGEISKKEKIILWISALVVTGISLAGFPLNFVPLIAIGVIGETVFLIIIGGPHGGGSRLVDACAGTAGVLVNTVVFYYLFRFMLRFRKARQPTWER